MPWDANRPRGDRKDLELAVRLGSSPPRRVEKPPAQRRHMHPRAPRAGDLPADQALRNRQTRRGQRGAQASRGREADAEGPATRHFFAPTEDARAESAVDAPPPAAGAAPVSPAGWGGPSAARPGPNPPGRPASARTRGPAPPRAEVRAGSRPGRSGPRRARSPPPGPRQGAGRRPRRLNDVRSSRACTRTHATDLRGDAGARPSPTQQNRCCRGPGRGRGRDTGDFRHAGLALTPASLPRACGTPAGGHPCVPTRSPRGKQGPGAQDGARLRPRRAEERARAVSRGQDAAALGHARGHSRAQRSGRLTADGEHQGG